MATGVSNCHSLRALTVHEVLVVLSTWGCSHLTDVTMQVSIFKAGLRFIKHGIIAEKVAVMRHFHGSPASMSCPVFKGTVHRKMKIQSLSLLLL